MIEIVSFHFLQIIYRYSYDRMSEQQPPRLGEYQLIVTMDSVIRDTRTLTLSQGHLSLNHSHCSFSSCDSVGSVCVVTCLLRDANGYILRDNDEKLVLELNISYTHQSSIQSDSISVNETFTNYGNGTCVLTKRLFYAGLITLRILDIRSQHYLSDVLIRQLNPLEPDIHLSFVNSIIPSEWQIQNPLYIELILMDRLSNMICDSGERIQAMIHIHTVSLSSVVSVFDSLIHRLNELYPCLQRVVVFPHTPLQSISHLLNMER